MENLSENLTDSVTKFIDVSVWVYGVKKRCRKASLERIDLTRLPDDASKAVTPEIQAMAEKAVRETMKSWTKVVLSFNHQEEETQGHMKIMRFLMFDPRNVNVMIEVQ